MNEIYGSETEEKKEVKEFKFQEIEDEKFFNREVKEATPEELEKFSRSPDVESKFCVKDGDKVLVYGNGVNNVNWNWEPSEEGYKDYSDEQGFDTRVEIKPATLEPGTIIDRYGDSSGRFVSPEGTPYEKRSLPYKEETMEYHKYEVIERVECKEGIAAPKFEREGGGPQYRLDDGIDKLIHQKKIRELE